MKKFTLIFSFAIMATLLGLTASAQILQRGTATTATSTNGTITINKPAGVVAGDVMIVNISQSDDNDALGNPTLAGWTLISGADLLGNTVRRGAVLYRVAGGSEPASYSFTITNSTAATGGIVAFSGVDATGGVNESGAAGGPFAADPGNINTTPNSGGSSTVTALATTTTSASAAVIMFAQAAGENPTFGSWTIGGAIVPFTELYDAGNGSNEQSSIGAAWGIKAVAGSTGNGTATLSASERNGGLLVTLKSGAVGPVTPASLWATSSSGTQISAFAVSNGTFISGPTNIFAATFPGSTYTIPPTSTAALGRTDQPSAANGHFYYLPNTGTGGVVEVYAATSTGGTIARVGSLDVNGAATDALGFVRLGMGPDGTGWILAGDGTTLYLAKFTANGTSAVTLTVEDASVNLVGGAVATFQNGDICVSGNGTLYALANNGAGVTQIFIGAPNGASTTLTKRWDLVDAANVPFTGSVNGVAFDAQGSLYISTAVGLYYIDDNTVNGPAGTVQCDLVVAVTGLQDLASNVFPTETTLPVRLNSFSGSLRNDITTLNWDASSETNFSHYEIQRSSNGTSFTTVGSKNPAGGTGRNAYQFSDNRIRCRQLQTGYR